MTELDFPKDPTLQLRELVREHLNVKDISELVSKVSANEKDVEDTDLKESKLKSALEKSGLIDKLSQNLMEKLKIPLNMPVGPPRASDKNVVVFPDQLEAVSHEERFQIKRGHLYMKLLFKQGRAFLSKPDIDEDPTSTITVHGKYRNQRFSTNPIISQVEPILDQSWMIELPFNDTSILSESFDPIHLVVERTTFSHRRSIIGTATWDWRHILDRGSISPIIEIRAPNDYQSITGLLDVQATLIPQCTLVSAQDNDISIKSEERRLSESHRLFVSYAKQWWNDFLQIRSSHIDRVVKIFAHNELSQKEPVTNYVFPLRSRWIETPRHASRFVSLISHHPRKSLWDSSRMEVWQELHSTLVLAEGEAHDHAILLCNLFLGFALDAFVTMGIDKDNQSHVWVTTIDANGKVQFWEPITGISYKQSDKHHFRTVDCCFNHEQYFANVQVINAAEKTEFDLENPSKWKSMSPNAIASMKRAWREQITLRPCILKDPINQESEIEIGLRQYISNYRQDHDLSCTWDDELVHILGQSLWGFEVQKLANISSASIFGEDFHQSVKRLIPEGHTFKGFPCQFNHWHTQRIFSSLLKAKAGNDLMLTVGDNVRFALRVRVFSYAESIASVWIILGVRYQSI